jgi:hypothetical protein
MPNPNVLGLITMIDPSLKIKEYLDGNIKLIFSSTMHIKKKFILKA